MPESWDERRAPSGAPLSNVSSVGALAAAGVKTALGVPEEWQVRTLLWEAAWAVRNSNGKLGRKDAVAMLSSNVEQMFGLTSKGKKAVFVAHEVCTFSATTELLLTVSRSAILSNLVREWQPLQTQRTGSLKFSCSRSRVKPLQSRQTPRGRVAVCSRQNDVAAR